MKGKRRRGLLAAVFVLLFACTTFAPQFANAIDAVKDNDRVGVEFTLEEFIESVEGQGFSVEILESAQTVGLFSAMTVNATQLKITKPLPSNIVTPFGDGVPGKGYLIANYEERVISGITYQYFISHVGHGIEMFSGSYSYDSHYSEYNFVNGGFGVEWHGSGQFTFTSYSSISTGFGWVFELSHGTEYIYRSPAYGWEFSFDFPQQPV